MHRLDPIAGRRRYAPGGERGVALLLVLMLIALVATVVAEFQYNSRIDLQLAYNARDELQAEYNALSALRLRALILRHSRKLSAAIGALAQSFGLPGGANAIPIGPILESFPVECGLMSAITRIPSGGDDENGGELFPGDCMATSNSEHAKISLNLLMSTRDAKSVSQLLMGMLMDPKLERHFQEDDRNGTHAESPEELVEAMIDWVDTNNTQAMNQVGDESRHYDFLRNSYRVKNAPLDSLAEVQLIHGVDDELFDQMKGALTIYTDTPQVELGTASIQTIVAWGLPATLHEGVLVDQLMVHPGFGPFLVSLVEMKQFGMTGFGVLNLAVLKQLVQEYGLDTLIDSNRLTKVFTDKAKTTWYTINAEGRVGNATRRIHAIFQAFESQFYYARFE